MELRIRYSFEGTILGGLSIDAWSACGWRRGNYSIYNEFLVDCAMESEGLHMLLPHWGPISSLSRLMVDREAKTGDDRWGCILKCIRHIYEVLFQGFLGDRQGFEHESISEFVRSVPKAKIRAQTCIGLVVGCGGAYCTFCANYFPRTSKINIPVLAISSNRVDKKS